MRDPLDSLAAWDGWGVGLGWRGWQLQRANCSYINIHKFLVRVTLASRVLSASGAHVSSSEGLLGKWFACHLCSSSAGTRILLTLLLWGSHHPLVSFWLPKTAETNPPLSYFAILLVLLIVLFDSFNLESEGSEGDECVWLAHHVGPDENQLILA